MAQTATIEGTTETHTIRKGEGISAGGVIVARTSSDEFRITVPAGVKIIPLKKSAKSL